MNDRIDPEGYETHPNDAAADALQQEFFDDLKTAQYAQAYASAIDETAETLEVFLYKLISDEPAQAVAAALCNVVAAHILNQKDVDGCYEEFGTNLADILDEADKAEVAA
jgi:hypothetical protein